MKIDRSKLAPVRRSDGITGRYFSDAEYAEDLMLKLRMIGATKTTHKQYTIAIGYYDPKSKSKWANDFRFLMGKVGRDPRWMVHPSRVNLFLNGGYINAR